MHPRRGYPYIPPSDMRCFFRSQILGVWGLGARVSQVFNGCSASVLHVRFKVSGFGVLRFRF